MALRRDQNHVVLIKLRKLAIIGEGGVEPLANLDDRVVVTLGFFANSQILLRVELGVFNQRDVVFHLRVGGKRLAILGRGMGVLHNREALRLKVEQHEVFLGAIFSSLVSKSLGDGHSAASEINLVGIHSNFLSDSLQELFNAKSSMAKSTVRQMKIILHQVFDLAVEDDYMKRNPTDSKRLFISSEKEAKREALEDFELRGIIKGISCLKREDAMLLELLIFTGMRRGEVIGLRWEDIDWKKRLIAVKRAVTYRNNRPVVGKTKSEAGNRLIPLDEQLAAFLQPCRQLNGYIIGSGEEPITETTFKRMWERIKKKINLYGATPHVFRHTYITLAASSGMDVKTLQSIAGHSDIKMTLDRYAHKRENNVIAAGGLISSVFRSM